MYKIYYLIDLCCVIEAHPSGIMLDNTKYMNISCAFIMKINLLKDYKESTTQFVCWN